YFIAADDLNVIRFRVQNVKDLSAIGVKSEVKRINGFPWQLKVFRDDSNNRLTVQVECNKSMECPLWECFVEGTIKLIDHSDDSDSFCKNFGEYLSETYELRYCDELPYCDVKVCPLEELLGYQNFVVDGCI
ncbi:hypothetical protein PENTCL1PPCAC_23630, partial [Pristionchus entomophagus]